MYIDKVFFYSCIIVFALTVINALVMYCVIKKSVKDALYEYNLERSLQEKDH